MIKKLIFPLLIAALAMPVAAMACPMGQGAGKYGGHFQKMDTNGDGVVTADEHAAGAAKRFTAMDANSDGKVTSDEMKAGWKEKRKGWKNKACPLKEECPKSKDCPMKEDCPYNTDRPKGGKK